MSFIIYGGLRYNQIRHALYCRKCNETIESISQYDLKYCLCGSIGIDGGILDGNRILGNRYDMETRSMYIATVGRKRIWLPIDIIEHHFYSSLNL